MCESTYSQDTISLKLREEGQRPISPLSQQFYLLCENPSMHLLSIQLRDVIVFDLCMYTKREILEKSCT